MKGSLSSSVVDWQKDQEEYIVKIKIRMTNFFVLTLLFVGIINLAASLSIDSMAKYTSIFTIILGLFTYFIMYKKQFQMAERIVLYGTAVILTFGAYVSQSASTFMPLGILIIISSFYGYDRDSLYLFIFSIGFMTYQLIIGKFTFTQTIIQPYGISLVNNVQILIGILPASYAVAYLIRKVLIKTINLQQKQYQQLIEAQELMLSQAQLESIRTVSGGLAHDFNNILTAILGNISLYKNDERLPEDVIESLRDMEMATLKAGNLSNQMLNFVKNTNILTNEIGNVNEIIQTTGDFAIKGRSSKILYNLDANLWGIIGDSSQISQVVQNLVINADLSMQSGGNVRINSANIYLDKDNEYGLSIGDYIIVNVEDQGSGIPQSDYHKIFQLFHTTREKGSGIGLAISKNIIKNHEGYINFKSEIGKGSNFYFIIPALRSIIKVDNKNEKSESLHLLGNVIIYDDNRDVIQILEKMLGRIGLNCFAATESKALYPILDRLAKGNSSPDIFILDLTIPGDKGGAELIAEFRQNYPEAYFIVSSGYSDSFVLSEFKKYKFDNLLNKPYSYSDLKDVLTEYNNKNH